MVRTPATFYISLLVTRKYGLVVYDCVRPYKIFQKTLLLKNFKLLDSGHSHTQKEHAENIRVLLS